MSKMNIAKPKRRTVWDFIKQQPLGFIGLILILIMSIAAIFSPEVAPYHPEDVDARDVRCTSRQASRTPPAL